MASTLVPAYQNRDEESVPSSSDDERSTDAGPDSSTTSTTGVDTPGRGKATPAPEIGHKETRAVNRSKLLVYGALLLAAATVGTVTYIFTRNQDEKNFQVEFKSYAQDIVDSTENNAENMFKGLYSLAVGITSYTHNTNASLPMTTIPDFNIRAATARELSSTEVILYSPIVSEILEGQWENYSVTHGSEWIRDGLAAQGFPADYDIGPIPPRIWSSNFDVHAGEAHAESHEGHGTEMEAASAVHDDHSHGEHHHDEEADNHADEEAHHHDEEADNRADEEAHHHDETTDTHDGGASSGGQTATEHDHDDHNHDEEGASVGEGTAAAEDNHDSDHDHDDEDAAGADGSSVAGEDAQHDDHDHADENHQDDTSGGANDAEVGDHSDEDHHDDHAGDETTTGEAPAQGTDNHGDEDHHENEDATAAGGNTAAGDDVQHDDHDHDEETSTTDGAEAHSDEDHAEEESTGEAQNEAAETHNDADHQQDTSGDAQTEAADSVGSENQAPGAEGETQNEAEAIINKSTWAGGRHRRMQESGEHDDHSDHGHGHQHAESEAGDLAHSLHDTNLPVWQMEPAPTNASILNLNLLSISHFERMAYDVLAVKRALLSEVVPLSYLYENVVEQRETLASQDAAPHHDHDKYDEQDEHDHDEPISYKDHELIWDHINAYDDDTHHEDASFADKKYYYYDEHGRMQEYPHDHLHKRRGLSQDAANETDHDHSHDLDAEYPHSFVLYPVFSNFTDDAEPTGFLVGLLPWDQLFQKILPERVDGMMVEVDDTCGHVHTYRINGPRVESVGHGSLHDPKYDGMEFHWEFARFARVDPNEDSYSDNASEDPHGHGHCNYAFNVYPSSTFHSNYQTNRAAIYTSIVILVFVLTAGVFACYDWLVQRRQDKVLRTATRTTKIVSSLFPEEVQNRLMAEAEELAAQEEGNAKKKKKGMTFRAKSQQLKDFLDDDELSNDGTRSNPFKTSKPIADLFPSCTVLFADMAGFTSWSSTREPAQVFSLLESVYFEFDTIARRRKIFKVETIGDCYVAVTGLPEPRADHAVAMSRFAKDCLHKMSSLMHRLEVELGPDTADLGLRIGLHSGQVTAGVLRGDKARFQLFGDSVNTAARMESTGTKNKIQISQSTADLLIAAGKTHWFCPRKDLIQAKGLGTLQTYWLEVKSTETQSSNSGSGSSIGASSDVQDPDQALGGDVVLEQSRVQKSAQAKAADSHPEQVKQQRLVDWNTSILSRVLKSVIAHREASMKNSKSPDQQDKINTLERDTPQQNGRMILDEVKEIILLPKFDPAAARKQKDADSIELSEVVTNQLRDYVSTIAALYHDNPFHNYEHASHVTMSTVKLLSRIVAPDIELQNDGEDMQRNLHDHTYGITSDPLTQFAVVLAALIHDVDHTGLPNSRLVQDGAVIAQAYQNKSVAEQNSFDISWDLLMDENYADLRQALYSTEEELLHFKQVVVNAVLATDIMDKEQSAMRKRRWQKAFDETPNEESLEAATNRKATIVIEHLIQASDVSHTMQHWHIFRKWNERLFKEMYSAYQNGKAETDPSEQWYKSEIGFFDFYIIPLAKKLKSCGVFGVSSDEYLNYAQQNRQEWEQKGQQIVSEMKQQWIEKYGGGAGEEQA